MAIPVWEEGGPLRRGSTLPWWRGLRVPLRRRFVYCACVVTFSFLLHLIDQCIAHEKCNYSTTDVELHQESLNFWLGKGLIMYTHKSPHPKAQLQKKLKNVLFFYSREVKNREMHQIWRSSYNKLKSPRIMFAMSNVVKSFRKVQRWIWPLCA